MVYLFSERSEVEGLGIPSQVCVSDHDTLAFFVQLRVLRGLVTSLIDKTRVRVLEHSNLRRRGRVVDCGGLENRYTLTGIVGSNPTASANQIKTLR